MKLKLSSGCVCLKFLVWEEVSNEYVDADVLELMVLENLTTSKCCMKALLESVCGIVITECLFRLQWFLGVCVLGLQCHLFKI